MAYDSPSDTDDESLYDLCLTGEFDQVDSLLRNGEPLDILDSPWNYFMKDLLSMENWRDKIRNIQLLYIYKCIRQLESTDQPAVYVMELKCNVKSWPYVPRFDSLAMELYEDVLASCRLVPTHDVLVPKTAIVR